MIRRYTLVVLTAAGIAATLWGYFRQAGQRGATQPEPRGTPPQTFLPLALPKPSHPVTELAEIAAALAEGNELLSQLDAISPEDEPGYIALAALARSRFQGREALTLRWASEVVRRWDELPVRSVFFAVRTAVQMAPDPTPLVEQVLALDTQEKQVGHHEVPKGALLKAYALEQLSSRADSSAPARALLPQLRQMALKEPDLHLARQSFQAIIALRLVDQPTLLWAEIRQQRSQNEHFAFEGIL